MKRGRIIALKELHSEELAKWDWQWRNGVCFGKLKSARRSISTVAIHPDLHSKFTVVIYEGESAQDFWDSDFKQFSRATFG